MGRIAEQYDFKGQRKVLRYDWLGRVVTNFWFAKDASYPSNSVEYYYNVPGQLTNITERSGPDASGTYLASVGPGGDAGRARLSQRAVAALARVPQEAQGATFGFILLATALAIVPRRLWSEFTQIGRRLSLSLWERARVRGIFGGGSAARKGTSGAGASLLPPFTPVQTGSFLSALFAFSTSPAARRLHLPSAFWRAVTYALIVSLLGTDPRLDFWSLHAECVYPPNPTTETTRVTLFTYDFDGHLTQVNCPEGVINYGYDLATGRHTSTCTTNSLVNYKYDELGRLETVKVHKRRGVDLTQPETTTYTYTAVGNRESVTLANNIVTTYLYDSLNRLTNLTHTLNGALLASYSYQLHPTGRRTAALEIIKIPDSEGGGYLTNNLSWVYDQMYRLTNEVSVSSAADGAGTYTNAYQYDQVGNRFAKIHYVSGSSTIVTNSFNDNDQLLREVTLSGGEPVATNCYAYDDNGSLIAKTNISSAGSTVLYGYDLKNKLITVTTDGSGITNSFLYDYSGIRVRSTVSGVATHYLIDANNHTGYAQILEELTAPGAPASCSYVIGDDVLAQGGTTASYLLYDGHGSTRQLANGAGTISTRYNYDAYGQTLATSTSSAETSLLHCGEQYDPGLGMYNLRARYYNPSNGRLNQSDTFQGSNFDPQSLHKYGYAADDPVDLSDPSGQNWLSAAINGQLVHKILALDFMSKVPGGISGPAISTILGGMYPGTYFPTILMFPDLIDVPTKQIYEIKPFPRWLDGKLQLMGYIKAFNFFDPAKGWTAGSTYMPPSKINLGALSWAIVYQPSGGVIMYDVIDVPALAMVTAGVIATVFAADLYLTWSGAMYLASRGIL